MPLMILCKTNAREQTNDSRESRNVRQTELSGQQTSLIVG
jgi:predicted DNA-binding helix-hairpin-helix protein